MHSIAKLDEKNCSILKYKLNLLTSYQNLLINQIDKMTKKEVDLMDYDDDDGMFEEETIQQQTTSI
jgi:hypothetical protein